MYLSPKVRKAFTNFNDIMLKKKCTDWIMLNTWHLILIYKNGNVILVYVTNLHKIFLLNFDLLNDFKLYVHLKLYLYL
jgi:hypothetical protein